MQFKNLKNKEIIHGISSTSFGSIRPVSDEIKSQQRAVKFLNLINQKKIYSQNLVFAKQIFSPEVHICSLKDSNKIIKNVDGLISNIPGQVLAITTGDCLPILLFDPEKRVVSVLHGSRECLIKGIIKNTVQKMSSKFQSEPKNILIGIGPHIRKCHYWLKEKTYQGLKNTEFKKYFSGTKQQKIYFDMTKIAFDQLIQVGIKRKNIEDCLICTFCSFKKYFSARKQEESPGIYLEKKSVFANFIGLN